MEKIKSMWNGLSGKGKIATVAIVPIYMWFLYNIKNSWTSNSHDTQGGSMTIVKDDLKVTFKDPIIKKK